MTEGISSQKSLSYLFNASHAMLDTIKNRKNIQIVILKHNAHPDDIQNPDIEHTAPQHR